VAIKRFYTGGKAPIQLNKRETTTLRIIQQSPDPLSLKANISQLIDYDIDRSLWHATTAYKGPTLRQFFRKMGDIVPECFFFHIFLQSLNALRFLHGARPWAIAHGDLHEGNILVDVLDVLHVGLPRLVLIDFGMGLPMQTGECTLSDEEVTRRYGLEWTKASATPADFRADLYSLSCVLHDLNQKSQVVREDDGFGFIDATGSREHSLTAEKVWEAWGHIALERRCKTLSWGVYRVNLAVKMWEKEDTLFPALAQLVAPRRTHIDSLIDSQCKASGKE
jgi:serine/threonine protein kinase